MDKSAGGVVGGGEYTKYSDSILIGENFPDGVILTFDGISAQWMTERPEYTTWYCNLSNSKRSGAGYCQLLSVSRNSGSLSVSNQGALSIRTIFDYQPIYPTSYNDKLSIKVIFDSGEYWIYLNDQVQVSGAISVQSMNDNMQYLMFPKFIEETPVSSYLKKFFFDSASFEYVYGYQFTQFANFRSFNVIYKNGCSERCP